MYIIVRFLEIIFCSVSMYSLLLFLLTTLVVRMEQLVRCVCVSGQ